MANTFHENKINWKRILAMLLIVALVFLVALTPSIDKSYGAEDPAVTVVNPINNTTVYANSILISIKLTAPETIKINLYKQVKNDAAGNPVPLSFGEWDKIQDELKAIASGSAVTTSPSIQVLQGWVMETVTFTSTGDLAFFTKKVENLGSGVYKIKIDTLDKDEKIIYSQDQIVFVKEKTAQPIKPSVFENSQPGTVSFLQNLLRSIFGK
ncbi:MAG: hypothetical protein RBS51_03175 [Anaerovoracaceae bacterium]|jgi:hypothetical protein|nr:hypothetical protein [Anaerovoracaceae bacterium]